MNNPYERDLNYTREQRQLLVLGAQDILTRYTPVTEIDRVAADVIVPAIIDLAQDCETLQRLIDAQTHTINTLKDMVRS